MYDMITPHTKKRLHDPAGQQVSIRQHTSANVSIRQHTSASNLLDDTAGCF
jgi:hypothetical protein